MDRKNKCKICHIEKKSLASPCLLLPPQPPFKRNLNQHRTQMTAVNVSGWVINGYVQNIRFSKRDSRPFHHITQI